MTACSVRFVGLDVHKEMAEACLVDAAGRVLGRRRFAVNRPSLEGFASQVLRPTDHVALEATTHCWAVAEALRPHVARVVVSNPMATKAIAQAKVKTDKVDACVLAQLLRCDYLPEVWPPDPDTQRQRELCGRRSALVGQRTALRNRIHSVLAMRLVQTPRRLFSPAGRHWLERVALDPQARLLIDSDLRQLDAVQAEIDTLEQLLAERGYRSPQVRLLMTLPGVDLATAEALLAAWGDPTRFRDADHAASYLGLVPSTRQSADHCYHGPITKRGRSQARWMLIEAAQHLDRNPGPLGHFFRRLCRKKNRNVAVVAAARKLATIAWRMLVTGEPYRYAIPRSTETKLARLRVKATGKRRPSGLKPGQKATGKLPGGSRTIRSLAEVCRSEGLPEPQPLSPGEQRTVEAAGCQEFVAQIAQSQIVPRRAARKARIAESHQGAPQAAGAQAPGEPAGSHAASAGKARRRAARRSGGASCPGHPPRTNGNQGFRPPRAGDQGDASPPPGPPTLFSVPGPNPPPSPSPRAS